MASLATPRSTHSARSHLSLSKRSTLSYHTQNLLLYPYSPSFDESDDNPSTTPLLEAIYFCSMYGIGLVLGYLATELPWPKSFAPLLGLGLLFYLVNTHTTISCPFGYRTAPSHIDIESNFTAAEKEVSNKAVQKDNSVAERESRLKAILAEKREGRLAGVFAFGRCGGVRAGSSVSGGGGPLWVIVEDMDN